ncbi:MAG TPA: hypothetical protein VNO50_22095 [Pyrinomonadaceae bacterium]|nr:hypothetical protein [Pyrinomonadaceae bacterium]
MELGKKTPQANPSFDCGLAVNQACAAKAAGFHSNKTSQFTYFAMQLADSNWRGKEVLDFGGNIGKILEDPNSTIDPEAYTCIDVVRDAVETGKKVYPESHWVFYNRYCFFFNPQGIPKLPLPDLARKFDYIVAYSVFTNTTRGDMLELVGDLEGMLAEGGTLAFTFIDPNYCSWPGQYEWSNFKWRLEREIELEKGKGNILHVELEALLSRTRDASWFTLVNGEDLYIERDDIGYYEVEQQRTCHVFYSQEYMKELFPHAAVLPPVNNEMQHCCVIRK